MMTPLSHQRRQPCLLDRLTDHHPQERDESGHDRMISGRTYEEALRRDLEWLLNGHAHGPMEGGQPCALFEYPEALRSVINYGMRQLVGQPTLDLTQLERRLFDAIQTFEPRINPQTLQVAAERDGNSIIVDISADYWAEPAPIRQLIKTRLDLDTGRANIQDPT